MLLNAPSSSFNDLLDKNEDQEDEDEDRGLNLNEKPQDKSTITPKWTTRVFAMECIRMVIETCKQVRSHLDLALAREKEQSSDKSKHCFVFFYINSHDGLKKTPNHYPWSVKK